MTHGFLLESCPRDASKALASLENSDPHVESWSEWLWHVSLLKSIALPVPTLVQLSSPFNQ